MATDQTTLRLGRADHGRPVSADEFAEADYDEPWKYERADGRLVVMFPDSEAHDDYCDPWFVRLYAYRAGRGDIIQKLVHHPWLRINGLIDRIGDIGVYLHRTDGITPGQRPERVPEIMIEGASPSSTDRRRDYVEKKAEYYEVGVREYVIVDRFARKVTVLTHGPAGYAEQVLESPDVYETPLLPGFRLALNDLF